MKKIYFFLIGTIALLACGCSKTYDDSALSGRIENLESRMAQLEALCNQMNSNISSLQTLVSAVQNADYITSIAPLTENGKEIGYTITFAKSGTVTIYHGKDGANGAQGEKGDKGDKGDAGNNGSTPQIGVKYDTDGILYWTLNGDWLLDENMQKIRVTGENGEPGKPGETGAAGITPQFKIADGYWFISYDSGANWTKLGLATSVGEQNTIFTDVTQDENNVYFTMADNTVITISKGDSSKFAISFSTTDIALTSGGASQTISYTITDATENTIVKALTQDGWKATVTATSPSRGTIQITAPDPLVESEILVFANDGSFHTVMTVLNCIKGEISVADDAVDLQTEGGVCEVKVLTNMDYVIDIPQDAQSWISVVSTRAVREDTIAFQVAPNNGSARFAVVTLRDSMGLALQTIVFQQPGTAEEYSFEMVYDVLYTTEDTYLYDRSSVQEMFTGPDFTITRVVYDGEVVIENQLRNCYRFNRRGDVVVKVYYTGIMTHINAFYAHSSLSSTGGRHYDYRLKTIDIPKTVSSFSDHLFDNCKTLVSLEIPEGVTSFPQLSSCEGLSQITLPQSLTELGGFSYCKSLKSLDLPESLTYFGGVSGPTVMEKLRLGRNIQNMRSFWSCTLKEIEFDPEIKITTIPNRCFGNSHSLITITIPKNVEVIEKGAFEGCESLQTVHFADGSKLRRIEDGTINSDGNEPAFAYCDNLSEIHLPNSLEYIGKYTFYKTPALTAIELPASLKTIAARAFMASGLQRIDIPDSVTEIGPHAFANCVSLEKVSLGSGLQSLGGETFRGCIRVKELSSRSAKYEITDDGRCLVGYDGALFAFTSTNAPEVYVIPSSSKSYPIKSIGAEIFAYAVITSLTLPETIEKIGIGALANSNLKTIYSKSLIPPTLYWTSDVVDSSIGGWMVGTSHSPLPTNTPCTIYVPREAFEDYSKAWSEAVKSYHTLVGYDF